jgi:hypothetical protein
VRCGKGQLSKALGDPRFRTVEINSNALLGIAEVVVAFVGISALVGIIGARANQDAVLNLERLKTVVLISLLVVVAALIPIVIAEYGLGHAAGWRVAGGIVFALNLMLLIYAIRAGSSSGLHAADKKYVLFGYGIEPLLQALLLCLLFGLFVNHASALYLTFLLLALAQAAVALVLLLNSLFSRQDIT